MLPSTRGLRWANMVPSTAGIQLLEKACPQEARAFEAACAPRFMSQHISVTLQHGQRQGLWIRCALTTSSEAMFAVGKWHRQPRELDSLPKPPFLILIKKQSLLKATKLNCIQAEDSAPQTPLQTTACMIEELHLPQQALVLFTWESHTTATWVSTYA